MVRLVETKEREKGDNKFYGWPEGRRDEHTDEYMDAQTDKQKSILEYHVPKHLIFFQKKKKRLSESKLETIFPTCHKYMCRTSSEALLGNNSSDERCYNLNNTLRPLKLPINPTNNFWPVVINTTGKFMVTFDLSVSAN